MKPPNILEEIQYVQYMVHNRVRDRRHCPFLKVILRFLTTGVGQFMGGGSGLSNTPNTCKTLLIDTLTTQNKFCYPFIVRV